MELSTLAWIAYLAPLVGVLAIALGGTRLGARTAGIVSCLAIFVAFVASIGALLKWESMDDEGHGVVTTAWTWLSAGTFRVPFELLVDPLSIWMLLVVTGVGFLIHVYSVGYMAGDPQFNRFMAYLNLFVFSMLTLVLAGNFVLLLVGWGLVGMASYLLIGFWHDRPSAVIAAKKAFIVNAIGDVTIMLAIFLIFRETGVLSFGPVFEQLPGAVSTDGGKAFLICLLLLGGAFAKSAQLPLHTWLPDAMEGPTPVSALIHAATMVTAGVYAVARLHPVFDLSHQAQILIFMTGGVTLLVAGFTALAQTDIKRVIAYSTMSQIGYMFIAAGMGAYGAAMFHLATHAFFKALLFLGAGIVIHALADEQDIRTMGGLRKHMPKTYGLFLVATLALSGVIPFAGFFSKDEILNFALAGGEVYGAWAYATYAMAVLGAILTGIYSFRLLFLVFHGDESELVQQYGRGEVMHHGHATNEHGEAPRTMFWPVAILGLLTVVGGWIAIPGLFAVPHDFLHGAEAAPTREALEAAEFVPAEQWLLALTVGLGCAVVGIGLAWMIWGSGAWSGMRSRFPRFERVFQRAFGFDAAYDTVFVRPAQAIAEGVRSTDEVVTLPMLEEIEIATRDSGRGFGRMQTGLVRTYAFATAIGMLAIIVAFLWIEA
ncbi:MAG: proton-translocating NADH-quinone oxidoreductase, chain [Thermoleophilia bacterium]|nr:proton-translocating NADH-quinone oxidoreductase, chain [Thermoleophilia bacterium]